MKTPAYWGIAGFPISHSLTPRLFEIVGEHYYPNVVRSRFGILLVKGVGFMQLRVSGSCGDCRNQISDNGA